MKELIKAVKNDIETSYKERIAKLNTEEGLKNGLSFENKTYKGNEKEKFTKFLLKRKEQELKEQLTQIEEINKAEAFKGEFIITIEWKEWKMWGSNPRAYTNYGFSGESIGGCGYCKLSTATAQALNSDNRILKLLYLSKSKSIPKAKRLKNPDNTKLSTSDINRRFLGYGAGYGVIPSFEGGVGVSSHQDIIKNLGLEMVSISDTKTTNVYIVRVKK